jgi:hypothetical protein
MLDELDGQLRLLDELAEQCAPYAGRLRTDGVHARIGDHCTIKI